ncbi:lysoplasmalogenase [Cohnella suwonensis]|uniref:Lysoplasmalogenase n=1 Tax=Cohnella suwonensis TaxID=696072 RepID=A0ABW0M516_9BACL
MRRLKSALPALIAILGLVYIFLVPSEPTALKLSFKLIPMALIIAYAVWNFPAAKERYHSLVAVGLAFCMIGDGTLGMFVVGLSAFLIGHLFYVSAFSRRYRSSRLRFATLVPLGLFAAYMGTELLRALSEDDKGALMAPVVLYILVICAMAWTAIMTGRATAIAGSLLFLVSDSILSWNMFVSDVEYAGPLIMLTYYAAQFLIAASATDDKTAGLPSAAEAVNGRADGL